jgi:putative ABC transport system permease protein
VPLVVSVALVFLIPCGNVSGLLLARGLQRQQEYAVRSALGARPVTILRGVLVES